MYQETLHVHIHEHCYICDPPCLQRQLLKPVINSILVPNCVFFVLLQENRKQGKGYRRASHLSVCGLCRMVMSTTISV